MRQFHSTTNGRPLPKVVVGQVILDHGVGVIQQVGHGHHLDCIFHASTIISGGVIETGHVENDSTNHGIHIFWIHVQRTSKGSLGAIDLMKQKGEKENKSVVYTYQYIFHRNQSMNVLVQVDST